ISTTAVRKATLTEEEVSAPGHPRKDSEGLRRQRQFMGARVLSTLRRKYDQLACKVDLAPLEFSYLAPALAGQQQETDNVAETIIAKAVPELAQFVLCKDTFARTALVCLGCALHWINVNQPLGDGPREHRAERRPGPIARHWA